MPSVVLTNSGLARATTDNGINLALTGFRLGIRGSGDLTPNSTLTVPTGGPIHRGQITNVIARTTTRLEYQIILGSDIGDFDFGEIGLYADLDDDPEAETLVVLVRLDNTFSKRKTTSTSIGNIFSINIPVEFGTGSTITVESEDVSVAKIAEVSSPDVLPSAQTASSNIYSFPDYRGNSNLAVRIDSANDNKWTFYGYVRVAELVIGNVEQMNSATRFTATSTVGSLTGFQTSDIGKFLVQSVSGNTSGFVKTISGITPGNNNQFLFEFQDSILGLQNGNTVEIWEDDSELRRNLEVLSNYEELQLGHVNNSLANLDAITALADTVTKLQVFHREKLIENEARIDRNEDSIRQTSANVVANQTAISGFDSQLDDIFSITRFVNTATGDDSNDGLTAETSYKTLDRAFQDRSFHTHILIGSDNDYVTDTNGSITAHIDNTPVVWSGRYDLSNKTFLLEGLRHPEIGSNNEVILRSDRRHSLVFAGSEREGGEVALAGMDSQEATITFRNIRVTLPDTIYRDIVDTSTNPSTTTRTVSRTPAIFRSRGFMKISFINSFITGGNINQNSSGDPLVPPYAKLMESNGGIFMLEITDNSVITDMNGRYIRAHRFEETTKSPDTIFLPQDDAGTALNLTASAHGVIAREAIFQQPHN